MGGVLEGKSKKQETAALIVAAGASARMGAEVSKPYLQLLGKPVLRRTVKAFLSHLGVGVVQVVIRQEDKEYYDEAVRGMELMPPVVGGATRQESVHNGLKALKAAGYKKVLIHDAARPLVSNTLITRVIDGLKKHEAVIPVMPVVETLKRIGNDIVTGTADRDGLYTAQTPQGFKLDTILDVHQQLKKEALTDDAALAERAGIKVATVQGSRENIKLTTADDMKTAALLMDAMYETRVGMGYDVHQLEKYESSVPKAKQTIPVCGVKIPFAYRAVGHSDADVGLHAIVDAILGACAAGDIGVHFSPDDPEWRGADSSRFLVHAFHQLKSKGGQLVHLDVTLICEKPKMAPHREEMAKRIANLLGLSEDRVSIKATTTEKLGYLGRGEGIAAQAIATVKLPRGGDE